MIRLTVRNYPGVNYPGIYAKSAVCIRFHALTFFHMHYWPGLLVTAEAAAAAAAAAAGRDGYQRKAIHEATLSDLLDICGPCFGICEILGKRNGCNASMYL